MAPPIKEVALEWESGLRFRGGPPGVPGVLIDGDVEAAAGPMDTLLMALAGCVGADVVHILTKMRVELARCGLRLRGTRRETEPRRYVSIHLDLELAGTGLDAAKAERAVALSLEKYCSVAHSLAPDIALTHAIRIVPAGADD
jgi:putative redox protein